MRTGMISVVLVSLMGAITGAQADTLKNKETGEILEGRLLEGHINNKRVFKAETGETRFLDMDNWVAVEVGGASERQGGGGRTAPADEHGPPKTRAKPGKLMTRGEVLADLFKRYRSLRAQHQAYLEQRKAANARVSDTTKSLAEILAEYGRNKRVVESVLSAAKAARAEALRVLRMPPPQRPRLRFLPSQPNSAFYNSAFEYDLALRNWERECERIKQLNEFLIQQYESNLRQYAMLREQATVNLTAANTKIAECEKALAALLEARQNAERPLKTERHELTEGTRDSEIEARKLIRDLKATTEAIREIPEKIRLEHGVVEWQNEFCSLEEIEQMYAGLMKRIEAARGDAKTRTGPTGGSTDRSPHPKEDKADALKVLIEKAKAAKERSVPE